jgi:hypothetical protein
MPPATCPFAICEHHRLRLFFGFLFLFCFIFVSLTPPSSPHLCHSLRLPSRALSWEPPRLPVADPAWSAPHLTEFQPLHSRPLWLMSEVRQRYWSGSWYVWKDTFLPRLRASLRHNDSSSASCLAYLLDCGYSHFVLDRGFPPLPARAAELSAIHARLESEEYSRIYPAWDDDRESGSWAMHHGLRNCTAAVRAFVADRWIIDIGAGAGDSLLVLADYSRLGVVSYEVEDGAFATAAEYAARARGGGIIPFSNLRSWSVRERAGA